MSRWRSPRERATGWQRSWWIAVVLLGAFLVLTVFDRSLHHLLYVGPERLVKLETAGWYQMVRSAGHIGTWMAIGLALLLHSLRWPRGAGRAVDRFWHFVKANIGRPEVLAGPLVMASAAASGLMAEILRPRLGRLRPYQTDGFYRYHGLPDDLSLGASYSFPSGHAAVAFGAAFMLLYFYRWPGVVALGVAVACSYSRLIAGAHFATDVFASAVAAYAIAWMLREVALRGAILAENRMEQQLLPSH